MPWSGRKFNRSSSTEFVIQKFSLLVFMSFVGLFTIFASMNTYEVIAQKDAPLTDVIVPVAITENDTLNDSYMMSLTTSYKVGSFGVPKKIKFPEADRHIDVVPAPDTKGWKASKGQAHFFLRDDDRQKVFGESVIYMRTDTPTTQKLGRIYAGDIVNIVTTEGWQLGYEVTSAAADPKQLQNIPSTNTTSEINVIMISDKDGSTRSFSATLSKVGERV